MRNNKMKTKVEKENNLEPLKRENQVLRDLINLREESYYRQQLLSMLERIAIALESSLKSEEESEEEED